MEFFITLSEQNHINLNDQQKAAVLHKDGPALVLAGPGSGKTTVIASRAAYLSRESGVHPRNILTVTFNRAAKQDMQNRFERLFGEEAAGELKFLHAAWFLQPCDLRL